MPSWHATIDDERAALERAVSRASCRANSLVDGDTDDGPHVVGKLECSDGWSAARLLYALALEDSKTAPARELAAAIRARAPDDLSFARAIHAFVRKNVRFQREIGEIFTGAGYTLGMGFGDCDDHARLVLALAVAGGLPARLAFLHSGKDPKHVLVQLGAGGGWQWAETTVAARFGEHPLSAVARLGLARADIAQKVVIMTEKDLAPVPANFAARNPGDLVALDAAALEALGYLASGCGALDDASDMSFRRGLLAFQVAAGITADGLTGPETRGALAASLDHAGAGELASAYRARIEGLGDIKLTGDLSTEFFRLLWAKAQEWKSRGMPVGPEVFLNVWTNESGITSKAGNSLGYAGLNGMGKTERANVGFSGSQADWQALTAEEQLPYVLRFYNLNVPGFLGWPNVDPAGTLYLLNFLPAYVGHHGDPRYVLADASNDVHGWYRDNKSLDVGGKGYIEVADMQRVMDRAAQNAKYKEAVARLYTEGPPGGPVTIPGVGALPGGAPLLGVGLLATAIGAAAWSLWRMHA